ncbi:peptide chain release factor N(5)-glutamine methyltransferase [Chryseobacterium oryzae]|uniref:peptide chain release factor N(5)-glutamine methyltransferase n=1 Tax=Chryseobacterium oryzae TaxID=2929799 RepID=A0ABY4BIT9_9FLAO|nr:peptide chain release factor N(5)-glutamine methyltransferase [Chryseobacterium oryzae]UOE39097.1 peptide chain release factor N(5)-glutamine methyltransferase [Chryseobacterium oryzae]
MKFKEIKAIFSQQLSDLYSESESNFMFQIFAEKILDLNAFQQRQFLNEEISEKNKEKFLEIISELKTGKPYQQILGETEFYGMKIFVDKNVLIPRPETEELLEFAIKTIQNTDFSAHNFKILDIGTGSGIIPLVLKKHFPSAEIISIDFSEKALEIAKKNAEYHHLNINFIHADYLNLHLDQNFEVIISNPPYIGIDEETEIEDSVKEFEPKMALFSPTSDPLIFYRKIAQDSNHHLIKNGLVFLEINQKLGKETLALYQNNFSNAELIQDLSGNDRFIFAVK